MISNLQGNLQPSKQRKSCGHFIKHAIKEADIHGIPVGLTFKNKRMIKSFPGGLATIIATTIVLTFLTLQMASVINKESTIKT